MDQIIVKLSKPRVREMIIQHNSIPGNAPVRFNPQDGGIVSVVKLDLRVSELSVVDVHKH